MLLISQLLLSAAERGTLGLVDWAAMLPRKGKNNGEWVTRVGPGTGPTRAQNVSFGTVIPWQLACATDNDLN